MRMWIFSSLHGSVSLYGTEVLSNRATSTLSIYKMVSSVRDMVFGDMVFINHCNTMKRPYNGNT